MQSLLLQSFTFRICDKHEIQNPVWAPSHDGSKTIRILGGGVERLEKALAVAREKFSDYELTATESGPLHTDQYCNGHLSVVHQKADGEPLKWIEVMQSTCELVLTGEDIDREYPDGSRQALYVVVPAHQVLSGEQCDQLSRTTNSALISEIREQVNAQITNTRYILEAFDHHFKVDLKQPPMMAFRKYFKNFSTETSSSPNWRCS